VLVRETEVEVDKSRVCFTAADDQYSSRLYVTSDNI
jgi:hypothetical protein